MRKTVMSIPRLWPMKMAHLSQRHFARGIEARQNLSHSQFSRSARRSTRLALPGGSDAGLAALTTFQAAGQSKQLRFSRDREQEADRIGLNTLARANRDPEAMSRMFERNAAGLQIHQTPPRIFAHPPRCQKPE